MSDADLYLQLAERHGHYCPMSTLGLRLGLEAVHRLTRYASNTWQLSYQTRTCAVDGIDLAMGISSLSTDLQVDQQGQHLLHCRSADGKELSLRLTAEAMQIAKHYQTLDETGQQQQLELLRSVAIETLVECHPGSID